MHKTNIISNFWSWDPWIMAPFKVILIPPIFPILSHLLFTYHIHYLSIIFLVYACLSPLSFLATLAQD